MDTQDKEIVDRLESDLLRFGLDHFHHPLRNPMTDNCKQIVRGLVESVYEIQGNYGPNRKCCNVTVKQRGTGLTMWGIVASLWLRVRLDEHEPQKIAVHWTSDMPSAEVDRIFANSFGDDQFRRWYRDGLLVVREIGDGVVQAPFSVQSVICFKNSDKCIRVQCEKSNWITTSEYFRKSAA